MKLANQIRLAVACAAALPIMTAGAGTVDRIKQEHAIRIAYREDAPPFSYKDKIGEPTGFMVDLCRAVAKKLAEQLDLPSLNAVYVPVTATDRFDAITQQIKEMYYAGDDYEMGSKKAIMGALRLYLDFINLFMMLMQLLGTRRN